LPSTVEIQLKIPPNLPLVTVDATQIHQILVNLCLNAAQAMPTGGRLVVALEGERLTRADCSHFTGVSGKSHLVPGLYVSFQVQDSGTGIEKKLLPRIFEPFFTTKSVGKGTGMGLAVVYGIVQAHGGEIQVYSEVGKGTIFKVYLPTSETAPVEMPVHERPVEGGSESILVVDDEGSLANMVGKSLTRLGYHVDVLTSSTEALMLFQRQPEAYDLVVSDQTMPGYSGDRLVEEIRKIQPKIPVILCSGYGDILMPEREKVLGIFRIIRKPFVGEELERGVRAALDQEKQP
jgi:CheY-like chemotaxis protein